MLSGNYLTFEQKSQQSGGSPLCRLCKNDTDPETLEHLIAKCEELSDIKSRITNDQYLPGSWCEYKFKSSFKFTTHPVYS